MQYIRFLLYVLLCVVWNAAQAGRPADTLKLDSLLNHIGEIQTAHPDSAMRLLNTAMQHAEASRDSFAISRCWVFEGLDAYRLADYDRSVALFFRALKTFERQGRAIERAVLYNNLGSVYLDLNQLPESMRYFEQAWEIMESRGNTHWMARIAGNKAGVYFMQEQPEQSINWLRQSIKYGLESQNYTSVAGAYSNLAMVLNALGRKDEALVQFKEGIAMMDKVGDDRGVGIVLVRLGVLQAENGDADAGLATLRMALRKAGTIGHKDAIAQAHLAMSNIFESTAPDSALFHHRAYVQWRDAMLNEERLSTIDELEKKYQSAKQKERIDRLELQSELDRASMGVLGTLIILVVLGSYLLYRQLQAKKRIAALLETNNAVIQQSLRDRETLMREMHHRVKNNFQLISAMLAIQAHALEHSEGAASGKSEASQALSEMRHRLQLMALTHQRLYAQSNIDHIGARSFLLPLIDEIDQSFDAMEVEIQTAVDEVEIPIQLAIHLGIIISELVMNAFKHAFEHAASPRIDISLHRREGALDVCVQDNGTGTLPPEERSSFGVSMVKSLVENNRGTVHWEHRDGMVVRLTLPL